MKKLMLAATIAATCFVGTTWAGPASNFAAHIREAPEGLHLLHSGPADTKNSNPTGTVDNEDDILTTKIKTANKKDLLIGVSLQSGLYTDTTVKGKNGSTESANAEGGIKVCVSVTRDSDSFSETVHPNCVVFAHRYQELNATLGGVIESCAVSVDTGTGLGTIDIAEDCVVSDEMIQLILSTTSANHFNFVAPNMQPGDHTITVTATAYSSAAFANGILDYLTDETACNEGGGQWVEVDTGVFECQTTDNEAIGWALVDVGSLTVQQVRAINQSGGITYDTDGGDCYADDGTVVACDSL